MTKNVGTIEYTIDAKTDKLLIAGRRADDTFDNIERGAKRADNSISKLNTTISKLAAAVNVGLLMMAAKRFIEIADNVKLLRARVSRLSGSLVEAKANFSGILEISKRTGMKIEDTTKLWESLTSALSDSNATSGQILQLTETLQQIGRIGGSSSEEAANALRQLGQAINGGIVRAEEFNSILESMPELWRRVAGQMGISMGELRRRMLEGKLTAEDVVNAILKGSGEIEKEFNKLPTTTEQALSQLNTDFGLLLETIDQTLHVTELVGRGVKTLADYCRELSGWFKTLKSDSTSLADKLWTLAAAFEPFVPGLDLFRAQAKQTDFLGAAPDNQSTGFVSTLPTQQATTDIKLKDNGGGDNKPKRAQKDPAEEALKRKRAELERLNQGFAEGSKEAEMWDAVQEMGANATAKQVSEMKNLAHLIYETNAAREHQIELEEKAKQLNEQFNPVDALKQRHALEMQQADELFNKQMINEETLNALKQQHAEELLASQWEQFRAQGGINGLIGDMADGLSGGATNAVVGLLNGTQNLETAFANIGTTILGKVVGSIAEMGAEYVKQMILSEAASASAMSGQAATAAATGASIASSMAPAAAATATATMGTAPMVAMSAISALMAGITGLFGGGRYNGGAVNGGNLYRVGEHGVPELFTSTGGKQYMIPGEGGRVTPGRDLVGSGGGITLNVTNNIQATNGWTEDDSKALQQTIENTAMRLMQRESQRPGGMLQPRRR
ncbi:tape measure protein [Escherichia coli]